MNIRNNKNIKIGIDARFYGPIGKGLGRYTQEIVDNIIRIQPDNEYVIFLSKANFDEFISGNKNVKKVLADVGWYTLKEQLFFPWFIYREQLDLMHFPHFNVPIFYFKKFVVTIHDLILTKYPTQKATTLNPLIYKLKNLGYKIVIWSAVKRAKKIIAVSEFTKQDIISNFKIEPDKIIVTYEGVANLAKGNDTLFTAKLNDKEILSSYNINFSFLLYVGNAYPHKNLEKLIDVFSAIYKNNPNLKLVLVGRDDYFYTKIKQYAIKTGLYDNNKTEQPIIFPGYVPDAELEILFKKALVYVFPSLYEGFGLPPLEAMAKGCPVISSDRSSLPEILGEAAIYFDPKEIDDIKEKVELVINNQELRKTMIARGLEQVKKYDWWDCAYKTLAVYKEILL